MAGRPDLRFHELRHTGAVLAAATGATPTELTLMAPSRALRLEVLPVSMICPANVNLSTIAVLI